LTLYNLYGTVYLPCDEKGEAMKKRPTVKDVTKVDSEQIALEAALVSLTVGIVGGVVKKIIGHERGKKGKEKR